MVHITLRLCTAAVESPYSIDQALGLQYFITNTPGIGGKLRRHIEDFVVEELPRAFPHCESGEYVHFTLEKTNWETTAAVGEIAKSLGISPTRFGYAGNKDKRALTRQRVGAWHVKQSRLKQIRINGIRLSDAVVTDSRLCIGDLEGNRFSIVVRNPDPPSGQLCETLRETREQMDAHGIPNYYGYQRFGTIRPNSHIVGQRLVEGDMEGAVMSYLGNPSPAEREDAKHARQYVEETRDYSGALKLYPKRLRYERLMLEHLIKNCSDYVGAIRTLPRNIGRLLVQSYQSHIFNRSLSAIIKAGFDIENSILPLIGFRTRIGDGPEHEIVKAILESEGVSHRDFYVRAIPELSSEGAMRTASLRTEICFTIQEMNSETKENAVNFEFSLPPACYATIVLREFMKADPSAY